MTTVYLGSSNFSKEMFQCVKCKKETKTVKCKCGSYAVYFKKRLSRPTKAR